MSELLEAFRTGDGADLIREPVRMVMQELMEAEATEHIGADRYERTELNLRVTLRDSARPGTSPARRSRTGAGSGERGAVSLQ